MSDKLYDKDSIQSLSPLEHVRLRPGMYVGNTANPNQLLLEIFANSLDEHNIGHGNQIDISIYPDNSIVVSDRGQGFPIDELREDGLSVLEASFSVTNTSGKFSEKGVYEGTSLGLNGLGSKLTNFLSHYLIVRSWNNGKMEEVRFKEGAREKRDVSAWTLAARPSGTRVEFKPSEEFFDSPQMDIKFFENFFHDICCLCPQLTVRLETPSGTTYIKHPGGIEEILPRKLNNAIEIIDNPFTVNKQKGKEIFSCALTWTGNSSTTILPYVNYGNTTAGPHITAMKSTITRVFNSWAKENNILKKGDKNLDGSSIQEGMLLICNIISSNVAYEAQIKTTVTKMDTSFITSTLGEELELWLDQNPEDATNILEKAILARKAAEAAKKAREAVKNKASTKKEKAIQLPTKLTDCWSKKRLDCELTICEGLSAASSLVAARDSEFCAVYGVRGKMLSVLKTTPEKITANQEINNLIQALGLECNYKTAKLKYDKNKLRYGKIIAVCDAK